MAECLRAVPMSQPDTGALTLKALRDNGIDVTSVQPLADIDVVDDVAAVRDACGPASRFARVTRAAGLVKPASPVGDHDGVHQQGSGGVDRQPQAV